jgi:hypothetical protein
VTGLAGRPVVVAASVATRTTAALVRLQLDELAADPRAAEPVEHVAWQLRRQLNQ